ncbi:MAG: hypothetical protein NTW82_07140 [Bacteroidia bacterium]|nr:hypothetical protein [Bacteroidia bacterium]
MRFVLSKIGNIIDDINSRQKKERSWIFGHSFLILHFSALDSGFFSIFLTSPPNPLPQEGGELKYCITIDSPFSLGRRGWGDEVDQKKVSYL